MKNEFWAENKKCKASIGFDVNTKNIASLQVFEDSKYDRDEYANGDVDAEYKFKPDAKGLKEAEELGIILLNWVAKVNKKALVKYTATLSESVKQLRTKLTKLGLKAAVGMNGKTSELIVWVHPHTKESDVSELPDQLHGYHIRIKQSIIAGHWPDGSDILVPK
jgi:hypothetical protein